MTTKKGGAAESYIRLFNREELVVWPACQFDVVVVVVVVAIIAVDMGAAEHSWTNLYQPDNVSYICATSSSTFSSSFSVFRYFSPILVATVKQWQQLC